MNDVANLLGPEPTMLPEDPAELLLAAGAPPREVVATHPSSSTAWAAAAGEEAAEHRIIEWYAFARVGYHRGLDALRRNGWRGQGPIPWEHEPNRGFLRCLAHLSRAAGAIGEVEEQERCAQFLRDSSSSAAEALL